MSQRFKIGDAVIVRDAHPKGHVRAPTYLRGKRGRILREFGAWRNPEKLAYGKPGWPLTTNYWVQFRMDEIWDGKGDYGPNDTITAEIYDHWLEPDTGTSK